MPARHHDESNTVVPYRVGDDTRPRGCLSDYSRKRVYAYKCLSVLALQGIRHIGIDLDWRIVYIIVEYSPIAGAETRTIETAESDLIVVQLDFRGVVEWITVCGIGIASSEVEHWKEAD